MTHTALARKYRPRRFAELAGQEHVAAGLRGAIVKNRVAHAYLLTGPRGVGKTTAARVLAMALNCGQRAADGEPCGACDDCHRIWSGSANLDVVEIDAASNRGVDDARDLRERAMYAASGPERHKVYIIDEAHMLTREAWNALLKILEEPPPRVVFVFATTEPQKIANAAGPVLSRVQRFDFRRIGLETIRARLAAVAKAEQLATDDDALVLLARVAAGGMRDALSLLDQSVAFGEGPLTVERVRTTLGLIADERFAELLAMVAERRVADVFPFVEELTAGGADLAEFVSGVGDTLRVLLMRLVGAEATGLTETMRQALDREAERYVAGDVLRMLRLLQDAETAIRRSPNARLHVEALIVQWTLMDRTIELRELLDRKATSSASAAPPSAPSPPARDRPPRPEPRAAAAEPRSVDRPTPPDLPSLQATWLQVVEDVGAKRPILKEALVASRPVALDDDLLTVELAAAHGGHWETLDRASASVVDAVRARTGQAVRLAFRAIQATTQAPPAPTKRLDPAADKVERLTRYRAKDPALDVLAESLDLELME